MDADALKEVGAKHLAAMKAAKYNYEQIGVDYDAASLNAAAATIMIDLQRANAPAKKAYGGSRPSSGSSGPKCPKCGGDMWDNRKSKKSPRMPDYKCKDRDCDGVIWPPRPKERDDEYPPEDDYGY